MSKLLTIGLCSLLGLGSIVTGYAFVETIQMPTPDDLSKIMKPPVVFGLIAICGTLTITTCFFAKNGVTFEQQNLWADKQ